MAGLTHFNEEGRANMVDVSEKAATLRTDGRGYVYLNAETFGLVMQGKLKKGMSWP